MIKSIVFGGALSVFLSLTAFAQTSSFKVPVIPACAKKCCNDNGDQGGTRKSCQKYCHKIYQPYTVEGTPLFQVSMLSSSSSPIRRLSECKNYCSRYCSD